MAVVEQPKSIADRLLTVADVAALPSRLPSGPVDYELVRGRLVMMSPTGADHGSVQIRLGAALIAQGEQCGFGKTFVETGVVLARNADTLYGPDVSFVVASNLPPRLSPEGYLETIPTLVAEVKSKNDTHAELNRKADEYLAAGVALVWIADPQQKVVRVKRPGCDATELSIGDVLTAETVIPDFHLPLAELFAE